MSFSIFEILSPPGNGVTEAGDKFLVGFGKLVENVTIVERLESGNIGLPGPNEKVVLGWLTNKN